MPELSVTKSYDDTLNFTEEQLDDIKDSIETFVNVTKLDSENIQAGGISASNLASNSVTASKIAAGAVTTNKINDEAVTGAKLNSNVVDDSTIEISSNQLQLKDGGVTQAKLEVKTVTTDGSDPGAGGVSISASCGTDTIGTGSYGDVTNLSCSLTVTGRPVMVLLIADGSNAAKIDADIDVKFLRDSTDLAEYDLGSSSSFYGSLETLDASPSADTYTYKVQAVAGSGSKSIDNYKLVVFEI